MLTSSLTTSASGVQYGKDVLVSAAIAMGLGHGVGRLVRGSPVVGGCRTLTIRNFWKSGRHLIRRKLTPCLEQLATLFIAHLGGQWA
jgi:hypothetical protein